MQLFVQTSNAKLSLQVNDLDTIKSLKEKILAITSFPLEKQRLVYEGKDLQDEHTFESYLISPGDTLHLVEPPVRMFQISVQMSTGKTIPFTLSPTDSVATLKSKIQETEGILPEHQCLVFNGQTLEDDHALESYLIGDGDAIHLTFPPTPTIQIYLKAPTDKIITLAVRPDITVFGVKQLVQVKEAISPELMILVFGNDEMEDSRTLSSYMVQESDTIHILLRS